MLFLYSGGVLPFTKNISKKIYSCSISFQHILNLIEKIEPNLDQDENLSIAITLKDDSSHTFYSVKEINEAAKIWNVGVDAITIYCSSKFSLDFRKKYSSVSYESSSIKGSSIVNFAIDDLNLNTGSFLTKFRNHGIGYLSFMFISYFSVLYNFSTNGLTIFSLINAISACLLIYCSHVNDQTVKIIMKNETDSFFTRKIEDLITNGVYTLIGVVLGYFLGKL